jgi:hypothetical protein
VTIRIRKFYRVQTLVHLERVEKALRSGMAGDVR